MSLWVAVLNSSARTAEKITNVHDIEVDEVTAEVCCVSGLVYTWDDDPEGGVRAWCG